jgi:hypothetical protein
MGEAIELYKQDGTTAGIFYCSECRVVHPTKEQAEWCHGERLCSCGEKITQGYQRTCDACGTKAFRAEQAAKEAKRFERAKKIKDSEYTGEHVMCGDSYYESVEEAIDQFLEGQEPEYVWACKEHGIPTVDLEDVTTRILEEMWDDAETSDLNGIDELEAALAAFNKANETIQMWDTDYSTAILVKAS